MHFGDSVFDSGRRQLLRDGQPVPLSPKAYQLLELLLERAPDAISKEEIQSALWPATFVGEASLTNLVAELRAAIGDRARDPKFLRTVHRFGYAFSGSVDERASDGVPAFASYRVQYGRQECILGPGENIVGREPGARVYIDHASVSRRHARIVVYPDRALLEDLQSRNGTFVDGRRIDAPTEIGDGAIIGLGPVTLTLVVARSPESTKSDLTSE